MKSNKLVRFANYGIEDVDQVVPAAEAPEAPEAPEVEIDETKTDEVAELETQVAEQEVGEVESDIEEMTDVAESLEAICFGIEATLKKGGLSKQGAAFALQSADLQLNRLGLEGIKIAVEDFAEVPVQLPPATGEVDPVVEQANPETAKPDGDNKTSVEPDAASVVKSEEAGVAGSDNTDAQVSENVAVSQEAMDNIKDKVKAIWEAIMQAISKVIEASKAFFAKIAEFTMRQARAAGQLAKDAAALPGNFYKKQKVKSRLKKALEKDDFKKLKEVIATAEKYASEGLDHIDQRLDAAYKDVLSADEADQAKGLEAIKALIEEMNQRDTASVATAEVAGESMEVKGNGVVSTASNEETIDGEFEVISSSDLEGLAKEAEDMAADTRLAKAKKALDAKYESIKNKASAFAKKVGEMGDKASSSAAAAVKAVGGFITGVGRSIASMFSNIAKFVSKTVSGALDYLKAQYSNFTSKENEDKGSEEAAKE